MEVRQLRIVLILTRQQQWYQGPAKPRFARLITIFVRFALTSGEKCPTFVSLAIFLRVKPSISTHSKSRTMPHTRLLKCFGLQHSVIKTEHLRSVVRGGIQGFERLKILGLSIYHLINFDTVLSLKE